MASSDALSSRASGVFGGGTSHEMGYINPSRSFMRRSVALIVELGSMFDLWEYRDLDMLVKSRSFTHGFVQFTDDTSQERDWKAVGHLERGIINILNVMRRLEYSHFRLHGLESLQLTRPCWVYHPWRLYQ